MCPPQAMEGRSLRRSCRFPGAVSSLGAADSHLCLWLMSVAGEEFATWAWLP